MNGITSIRDMGGLVDTVVHAKDLILSRENKRS